MTSARRPLWQPSADPATDTPPAEPQRLLPAERLPLPEPLPAVPHPDRPRAEGGRRPLGPGGLTFTEAE
ncbi:hypothetical protein ACIG5E_38785 [Kitasatospora sp. NPDC053057]|uniref:hypothetical protein n=1 Tax=Kitasatospora sp. NPDC053057 TaxID=3364062 RepID=UPI0037C67FCC